MRPPVLIPAGFIAVKAERFFFAKANDTNPFGIHPLRDQVCLGGMGTALTQSNVVIVGASLITMAMHLYLQARIVFEIISIPLKDRPGIIVQIILVKFKMNILQFRRFFERLQSGLLNS